MIKTMVKLGEGRGGHMPQAPLLKGHKISVKDLSAFKKKG